MKKLILCAIIALTPLAAVADNPNWSAEKAATVDANRHSNAGIGNGGERLTGNGWAATIHGEDGGQDVDPGNSADHNQACSEEGHQSETSC